MASSDRSGELVKKPYSDDEPKRIGRKAQDEKAIRVRLSSPDYVRDAHSKSPQAIFKITSFAKGAAVRRVMEYVTRTDRDDRGIPAETEDGTQLTGKDDVQQVYEEWAEDFERKKPGRKTDPRHATHMVLSAKTDNSEQSTRKVHAAASEFLRREFGDRGYQYMFVVHRDTENPHVHVVMKNKNNVLGKKLRIGKAELFELRQQFAKALNEKGLEAISTLRRDRPAVIEAVAKRLDTMKNRSVMLDERLKKTERTPALDTLSLRRSQVLGLQRIKDDIKNNSAYLDPQRKELTKQLNDVQRTIVKNDKDLLGKRLDSTVKFFEKEDKQLSQKLAEIVNAKKPTNKEQRLEVKKQKQAFTIYSEKYSKGLKQAVKDVKSNKAIPDKLKKETLKRLNTQRRSVEKLKAKALGFGM